MRISDQDYRKALRRLSRLRHAPGHDPDDEDCRPELQGVLVERDGLVSSDGHRLARIVTDTGTSGPSYVVDPDSGTRKEGVFFPNWREKVALDEKRDEVAVGLGWLKALVDLSVRTAVGTGRIPVVGFGSHDGTYRIRAFSSTIQINGDGDGDGDGDGERLITEIRPMASVEVPADPWLEIEWGEDEVLVNARYVAEVLKGGYVLHDVVLVSVIRSLSLVRLDRNVSGRDEQHWVASLNPDSFSVAEDDPGPRGEIVPEDGPRVHEPVWENVGEDWGAHRGPGGW